MKTGLIFAAFLLLVVASAQQDDKPQAKGTIYGVATDQSGQPAKRIGLTASPLAGLAALLPHTRTNDAGEYRFENLPWWGKYIVYADDEEVGYSSFSTGPSGGVLSPVVELTPERPEAELQILLPAKAGFIQVRLTNQQTDAGISAMRVTLMLPENPASPVFTMSSYANHVTLIPPDKDLLLHVTSDGFREWSESVGKGKLIHLASGARLKLDVRLQPVE